MAKIVEIVDGYRVTTQNGVVIERVINNFVLPEKPNTPPDLSELNRANLRNTLTGQVVEAIAVHLGLLK